MNVNSINASNYQRQNYSNVSKAHVNVIPNVRKQNKVNTDLRLLNPTYNQININFKGIEGAGAKMLKQIPLEDRLASIFQTFKLGDVILVGKNLNECAKKMYNSMGTVQNAIKRSFFIQDDNFKANLGFIKNPTGETEVINLNDTDINLISDEKVYSLNPQESFYVIENDVIKSEDSVLKIKNEPITDLSMYRAKFAKAFDYNDEVKENLDKINKKTISQLISKSKTEKAPITFKDVGGLSDLKQSLKKDIINPIRYPEAYENMECNKGFILYGPPGTGKTHIVRALANEADAEYIYLNGLDLESKWVGESEANWRALFQEAKDKQPTIVCIDEFDAVARSRSSSDEYGNKVVNQILTLMTDIDNAGDQIYIIGATNNYKSLDPAITRSGRFGKHFEVAPPNMEGLNEIFKVYAKNKPIDKNVDINSILEKLHALNGTGADVRFIVNEAHNNGYERAGIFKKMDNKTFTSKDLEEFSIMQEDFDKAFLDFIKDKTPESKSKRNPIGFKK